MWLNASSSDDFDEHNFSVLSMEMKEWISFYRNVSNSSMSVSKYGPHSLSEKDRVDLLHVSKWALRLKADSFTPS